METANGTKTMPATVGSGPCHDDHQGARNWLGRRRGMVIAGVLIVGAAALALSQHWLTIATLTPLFFVLPCLAMTFMCMKSMNRDEKANASEMPLRNARRRRHSQTSLTESPGRRSRCPPKDSKPWRML